MRGSELDFTLFYMLLPEEAPTLADTQCDRILDETNGTVYLLGDRLLLRQKQIKSRYRFQAADDYRIRIRIRQMVFDPILQCEPSDECSYSDRQFDSLLVSERDLIRCFYHFSTNENINTNQDFNSITHLFSISWSVIKNTVSAYGQPTTTNEAAAADPYKRAAEDDVEKITEQKVTHEKGKGKGHQSSNPLATPSSTAPKVPAATTTTTTTKTTSHVPDDGED